MLRIPGERTMSRGILESIYIAATAEGPMYPVDRVRAIPGAGFRSQLTRNFPSCYPLPRFSGNDHFFTVGTSRSCGDGGEGIRLS